MVTIAICLSMQKSIFKFKVNNENVIFPTHFYLGSISNVFGTAESREISLNGNVYNLSVRYNAIDKTHILNISRI